MRAIGPARRLRHLARGTSSESLGAGGSGGSGSGSVPVPLSLELLAAVLGAGASVQSALDELLRALDPEPAMAVNRAVEPALALSAQSGLPPADLLRAAAARERSRCSAAARVAIRRLEVLLVIPAGLCLLPAFVLLGVAPVVIALFTQ